MNSRRHVVAVIGNARLNPGSEKYKLAQSVGEKLVDERYRLLTGGLGGVMEAACRGARSSAGWYEGCSIGLLPGSDPAKANPYVDIVIPTGLDHGRNSIVAQADAVVAIGGGAGTLSEIAFAWIHKRLIIGLKCDGWSGRLADQRVDERVRYPDLLDDRVYGAQDATEVLTLLRTYLPAYIGRHSLIA
jgi:uncharacterized protein (TIGR00725 family)